MSKLLFKEQIVYDSVLQSLGNTISEMNQASQKTYSMSIPSGFSKYTELSNCKSSIIQLTKELQELQTWINNSCKKFDNALTSMNNEALLLPQSQLQVRKEVVR